MTILEEPPQLPHRGARPPLCEDAQEMAGRLAPKQTSQEATVLLYAPALDPHLQEMAEMADRVFCIYGEPAAAKGRGKAEAKMPGDQRTLEAYS
jgi:hypothetical protein